LIIDDFILKLFEPNNDTENTYFFNFEKY